jgi:hypothetical protein
MAKNKLPTSVLQLRYKSFPYAPTANHSTQTEGDALDMVSAHIMVHDTGGLVGYARLIPGEYAPIAGFVDIGRTGKSIEVSRICTGSSYQSALIAVIAGIHTAALAMGRPIISAMMKPAVYHHVRARTGLDFSEQSGPYEYDGMRLALWGPLDEVAASIDYSVFASNINDISIRFIMPCL